MHPGVIVGGALLVPNGMGVVVGGALVVLTGMVVAPGEGEGDFQLVIKGANRKNEHTGGGAVGRTSTAAVTTPRRRSLPICSVKKQQ